MQVSHTGQSPAWIDTFRNISAKALDTAKDILSVASEIARDIESIFRKTNNEVPRVNVHSSASTADADPAAKTTKLYGFRELGDRAKGVSAGFTAKLEHTDAAIDKLLRNSGNSLNDDALKWLNGQLDLGKNSKYWLGLEKAFKLGLQELNNNTQSVSQLSDAAASELDRINSQNGGRDDFKDFGVRDFSRLAPELKDAVFQETLKSEKKDGKVSSLHQTMKKEILEKNLFINKKEYLELPDIKPQTLLGKYLVFKARHTAKISTFINMVARMDESTRNATRTQGARQQYIHELAGKLGLKTNHLKQVFFDNLKTGMAVIHKTQPEGFTEFKGKESAGIQGLGSSMAPLLVLGDPDPLKNKGTVTSEGATHFYSNESKSFLNDGLLGKRVGVNSDFSLNSPSQQKKFGIFNQSTFAEKMEGVRKILDLKTSGKDPQESMKAVTARIYIDRREEILETFKSRLEVYQFEFGTDISDKDMAHAQTFNILDGLEKLTSKTAGTSNGIRLDIPQVQKPEHRKEWNVQQNSTGDQIQFTFQGSPAESEKILQTLQDYSAKGHESSTAYSYRRGPEDTITVTINSAHLAQAQAALSYANIMDYKHPQVAS